MTFTTLALTGERVLVKGTDNTGTDGQVVLDSSEWNSVQRELGFTQAHKDFDEAVENFYRPLVEAAEKAKQAFVQPEMDSDSYVVVVEGSDGERPVQREIRKLGPDSIVLRILESGDHDRLVWVNERLEVLATLAGSPQVVAPGPEAHEDGVQQSDADGPLYS